MKEVSPNKTVLVVEDEKPLLGAITLKLETKGFDVLSATTVAEALRMLEERGMVDAIWLDHYLLGKEEGLDLVTRLKASGGKWTDIPIFVVSNTASAEKVEAYLTLGVKQYYVKAEHRLNAIIEDIESFLNQSKIM